MSQHKFTICLWFENQAEEAAKFYTEIFKDGKIGNAHRYGKEGFEFHQQPEGTVMTIEFTVNSQQFLALNGGSQFKFNEAISLIVTCENQEEVDYYWQKLTADGGVEVQCGWLKDKFGLSWQVVPVQFQQIMQRPDQEGTSRAMNAMFQMKKFDIAALEKAYLG